MRQLLNNSFHKGCFSIFWQFCCWKLLLSWNRKWLSSPQKEKVILVKPRIFFQPFGWTWSTFLSPHELSTWNFILLLRSCCLAMMFIHSFLRLQFCSTELMGNCHSPVLLLEEKCMGTGQSSTGGSRCSLRRNRFFTALEYLLRTC